MCEIACYILQKRALTLPMVLKCTFIVCAPLSVYLYYLCVCTFIIVHLYQCISRPKCEKCPLCICYLLKTFYLFDFKDFFMTP